MIFFFIRQICVALCYIFSLIKGLANSNAQSASFKMLEQALEMDLDLSQLHGSAKAPREEQSGDNPLLTFFSCRPG